VKIPEIPEIHGESGESPKEIQEALASSLEPSA